MRIALLCPTRERVYNVKRLVNSILQTTNNLDNLTLYFGVDKDDPTLTEVREYTSQYSFIKIIEIDNAGTFLGLGKIWNLMVKDAPEDILSMVGDDMVFETIGWDNMVIDEFINKGRIKLLHFNDGMKGPGNPLSHLSPLAVNSFIHRIYYDTFGYYVREEWKHWYHDTWLHDVFSMAEKRVYHHDCIIRHLHPDNPQYKGTIDKITTNLNNSRICVNNPQKVYDDLLSVRKQEAEKLRELSNA